MKLLFVTQVVDEHDSVLGAYHGWIAALAAHVDAIEVICLKEGEHHLPSNVRVHSLGKEKSARSRSAYAFTFLGLAWRLRGSYDAAFVHMNQEYILIAGWLWKLLGKRVYMWRNHYAGSWLTDAAAAFCARVFCTSTYSYTAKYAKTVLMPVGIDTEHFKPDERIVRTPRSILFLARIAPSKRVDLFIEALSILKGTGTDFTASIVGDALPAYQSYYDSLRERVRTLDISRNVSFLPSVPNTDTPDLYRAHDVFVNCSPSGMLDKTIFEAAACGCFILASSEDIHTKLGKDFFFEDAPELAERTEHLLSLSNEERSAMQRTLADEAEQNSLSLLSERLSQSILNQS